MNGRSNLAILFCAAIFVSGCVGPKTYRQKIEDRPIPTDQQQVDQECAFMRQEIARQGSLTAVNGSPLVAAVSSQNIAALESRSALLNCRAAFSSSVSAPSNPIEQCISACKANTGKPADECFTLCNR